MSHPSLASFMLACCLAGLASAEAGYSYDSEKEPFLDHAVTGGRAAAAAGHWEALGLGYAGKHESSDEAAEAGEALHHAVEEIKEHLHLDLSATVQSALAARQAASLDTVLAELGAHLVRLKLADNLHSKLDPYDSTAARNRSVERLYTALLAPLVMAKDREALATGKPGGSHARVVALLEELRSTKVTGGHGLARLLAKPDAARYRELSVELLGILAQVVPSMKDATLDYHAEVETKKPATQPASRPASRPATR